MKVGVIGLGGMGTGLAESLLRASHAVTVWNRSSGPGEALKAKGAALAASAAEVFAAEVVVTMLADDQAVREVILKTAALDHAAEGAVHVLSATVSVAFARELEAVHRDKGVAFVAAPVLGRPDVAQKGELNVIAAGPADALARVRPVLDAIGSKTWVMGEAPHLASVAKLGANFMIASTIETLSEAFVLNRKNGVDPRAFFELVTGALFSGRAHQTYGALILDRQFEPAKFKLKLGLKDVRLALAAGEAVDAPLPFASLLRDTFVDAVANGGGDKDWSAVSQVAFRRAGLKD